MGVRERLKVPARPLISCLEIVVSGEERPILLPLVRSHDSPDSIAFALRVI